MAKATIKTEEVPVEEVAPVEEVKVEEEILTPEVWVTLIHPDGYCTELVRNEDTDLWRAVGWM